MQFIENDGGRKLAGYKGIAGDCVTRAIAIVTNKPYQEVYDSLFDGIKDFAKGKSKQAKRASRKIGNRGTTPRNGVSHKVYDSYLKSLGYKWVPTMFIGKGCKVHLKESELPKGRLVVKVSKHLTSVIDGIINDTYDPSRDETRCVYGYYIKE